MREDGLSADLTQASIPRNMYGSNTKTHREIWGISMEAQRVGLPMNPADTYDYNMSLCGMVDVGGKYSVSEIGQWAVQEKSQDRQRREEYIPVECNPPCPSGGYRIPSRTVLVQAVHEICRDSIIEHENVNTSEDKTIFDSPPQGGMSTPTCEADIAFTLHAPFQNPTGNPLSTRGAIDTWSGYGSLPGFCLLLCVSLGWKIDLKDDSKKSKILQCGRQSARFRWRPDGEARFFRWDRLRSASCPHKHLSFIFFLPVRERKQVWGLDPTNSVIVGIHFRDTGIIIKPFPRGEPPNGRWRIFKFDLKTLLLQSGH
ncbi:hypothetical protein FB451DRAFT_1178796 [Mycena latifolia]|nr:hypothetical protein FB451DRAFT_1178796 [Mycena latifolia]